MVAIDLTRLSPAVSICFCSSSMHKGMDFADEVSFLEQHIQLLNRGALQEALQMASARLQILKSSPASTTFDSKVCVLISQQHYLCMTLLANTQHHNCRLHLAEHPTDFCRTQRLAV
jgi:hypothetical protein